MGQSYRPKGNGEIKLLTIAGHADKRGKLWDTPSGKVRKTLLGKSPGQLPCPICPKIIEDEAITIPHVGYRISPSIHDHCRVHEFIRDPCLITSGQRLHRRSR